MGMAGLSCISGRGRSGVVCISGCDRTGVVLVGVTGLGDLLPGYCSHFSLPCLWLTYAKAV